MRKYIYIGLSVIVIVFVMVVSILNGQLKRARNERDIYKNNTEILMSEAQRYKTKDSLNAITVGNLELKFSEFERFRADDADLIRTLRTKNRDLERITTTQLSSIYELQGDIRDSIVYRDNHIPDTLRCVDIIDKWFELHGCADAAGRFSGTFESRDSLLYVETVRYRRFLGFLWKTSRIRDRQQDIVSRNPHTTILDAEFITIRK